MAHSGQNPPGAQLSLSFRPKDKFQLCPNVKFVKKIVQCFGILIRYHVMWFQNRRPPILTLHSKYFCCYTHLHCCFATFEYIVDMSDRSPNNFSAKFTVLNDISAPQRETGGVPSRQSSVSSPSTASLVVGVSSVDPFCNFRRFHSSPSFSSTFVALFIYFTSRKTCSTFKYISWNIFGWQQSWIWKGTSGIIFLGLPPVSSTDLSVT